MPGDVNLETALLSAVQSRAGAGPEVNAAIDALQTWRRERLALAAAHPLHEAGLDAQAGPARLAAAVVRCLHELSTREAGQLAALDPARQVAAHFDEQVILLLFGKFNAGKSSLCNLLAARLQAHGLPVRYFRCDAQGVHTLSAPLQEGATETTQQLQGVQLGERLVLLDTPGLHSMDADNAALTRRYLDSADGVLWLTSSASPGQVQELDELGRELLRGKPLLPIITRSDRYEEDELDGEIVKVLCNKTPANRQEQEQDVRQRAADKLGTLGVDATRLHPPLSVSARMANEHEQTPAALAEAGFGRLYAALLALMQPVLAYKARKPAEVLLHHAEENLSHAQRQALQPQLQALLAACDTASADLETLAPAFVKAGLRDLLPGLAAQLQAQADHPDPQALASGLNAALEQACRHAREILLGDYRLTLAAPALALEDLDAADAAADLLAHYRQLEHGLHGQLTQYVEDALAQARDALARLRRQAEALQAALADSDARLSAIGRALRHPGQAH